MQNDELAVDAEAIAALLDGRLVGEERARVLAVLARSDAALEVFAEAARLKADLDAGAGRGVPRRRWVWAAVPVAAAAAAVLAVEAGWLTRRAAPAPGVEPGEFVAALPRGEDLGPRLAGGWEQHPWSVTRGGADRLVEPEAVFRLGVRTVELQAALRVGDTVLADRLAVEMSEWLAGIELSQPLQARLADVRAGMVSGEELIEAAVAFEESLQTFLQSPRFAFGEWCAAAALAARAHDATFFQSELTSRVLGAADRLGLTQQERDAVREIGALIQGELGDAEYQELQDRVSTLIGRAAG